MIKGEKMTEKVTNQQVLPATPVAPTVVEQNKINLRYQRDKDRQMVKGIFKFYEVPGSSMQFCYKAYKEDKVETFNLVDGETYTIPLGVAKHLNKNGWYPVHNYAVDEHGKPVMKIGSKVRRFGFQSLEFLDIEDLNEAPQIVTVENVGVPIRI